MREAISNSDAAERTPTTGRSGSDGGSTTNLLGDRQPSAQLRTFRASICLPQRRRLTPTARDASQTLINTGRICQHDANAVGGATWLKSAAKNKSLVTHQRRYATAQVRQMCSSATPQPIKPPQTQFASRSSVAASLAGLRPVMSSLALGTRMPSCGRSLRQMPWC
jgi:hypothetical protein